jgi:hypothetical protein
MSFFNPLLSSSRDSSSRSVPAGTFTEPAHAPWPDDSRVFRLAGRPALPRGVAAVPDSSARVPAESR